MGVFVVRRLIQAVPTFFGITLLAFTLTRLAPGDPITLMVFGALDRPASELDALRRAYGLDQPLPLQYLNWLTRLLAGDFGESFQYKRPALDLVAAALPNTLQLSVVSLVVALVVGVPLGALAARNRGTLVDQVVRVLGVAGHAVPSFWLALVFILVLAVELRQFPVGGMTTIGAGAWDIGDRLRHLVGPVVALSLGPIANFSRLMRTETLEVLGQDYIRTARAKGLGEAAVLAVHGVRGALLPVITALGSAMASIISGAVVVEQVFAWPGMGRVAFDAARAKDYPIVMAVVVLSSAVLLLSYVARDVAYAVADPRARR